MSNSFPNFRYFAQESLDRAKAELATTEPHRLRYAALELRYAMESLTYDRAIAFHNEIPPEEYKTWQPRKLMAVLHDIDPSIGMTSTISIGSEVEYGKSAPRENMRLIGTDTVFTLADLKRNYDAVGSFLHMPSLSQVEKMQDPTKLRERCEAIAQLIEKVLKSEVWNCTLGVFTTHECVNEDCKKPIRRRLPAGQDIVKARCFECEAEYTITSVSDGRVRWTPMTIEIPCSTDGCIEKMLAWPHEIRSGTHWRCCACGAHNQLALGVRPFESEEIA